MSAMFALLRQFIGWTVSAFRSRQDLILENLCGASTPRGRFSTDVTLLNRIPVEPRSRLIGNRDVVDSKGAGIT